MKKDRFMVAKGEPVGTVAAESIGEPQTQTVLKTFHSAGILSSMLVSGLPRLIEIVDARKSPKQPFVEIGTESAEEALEIKRSIEEVTVGDLIGNYKENFEKGKLVMRINKEALDAHRISERELMNKLESIEGIAIKQNGSIISAKLTGKASSDMKKMKSKFIAIRAHTIAGVKGIRMASVNPKENGKVSVIAIGSNIEGILSVKGVNKNKIYSNDPFEVARVFGIEAARELIFHEIMDTMISNGISIDARHVKLLADAMTYTGKIKSIGRHGIAGTKKSVLAKAAYEETVKHFIDATMFGEVDKLRGVSENILIGKQIGVGTGMVKIGVKKEDLSKMKSAED